MFRDIMALIIYLKKQLFFIEAASIPTEGERVEYLLAFTLGSELALVDTNKHTHPHTS